MNIRIWLVGLLCVLGVSHAGDGHDHGVMPGLEDKGEGNWLELSSRAAANIGLTMATATRDSIYTTLPAIGRVEAAPGRMSELSSRVSGQVEELHVSEGSRVSKGQLLLKVRSALPGNPPPLISFIAPRSGIVTRLHVTQGSRVTPDEHLLDVVDLGRIHVRASIHEGQIRQLEVGQQARIRMLAWPDELLNGELKRLGGELDRETGTLPAWFEVDNPDGRLRPNMRAELSILIKGESAALVLPRRAINGDAGQEHVYVARDFEGLLFEEVEVALGLRDESQVQILEGILEGERVVVQGSHSMEYMPRIAAPDFAMQEVDPHAGHNHAPGEHDHAAESMPENVPDGLDSHEGHEDAPVDSRRSYVEVLMYALLAFSLPLNAVLLLRRDKGRRGDRT